MWIFGAMESISFGMVFFYVATHKVDSCWEELIRWGMAVITSAAGFLASYCITNEKWTEVPAFLVWTLVVVCIGYFIFRWVVFFVDRKEEIKSEKKNLKHLKCRVIGKPRRGISFASSGNTAEDVKKLDDARAKRETATLILGSPRMGSKRRFFEESAFRLELVPRYVRVIEQFVDPKTGKRYFSYVDTYGKKDPEKDVKETKGRSTSEEVDVSHFDFDKVFAAHDTYDGCTKQEILDTANKLLASINKFDEPIVATPDFLLLIDCINGLSRHLGEGYSPSWELQQKHIGALCSLAQDVIAERARKKSSQRMHERLRNKE